MAGHAHRTAYGRPYAQRMACSGTWYPAHGRRPAERLRARGGTCSSVRGGPYPRAFSSVSLVARFYLRVSTFDRLYVLYYRLSL